MNLRKIMAEAALKGADPWENNGELPVQPHVCRCCGEETETGEDCCSDDFPEPGDIRETGR